MAAARLYRAGHKPRGPIIASMVVWSGLSMLPDADVLGFRFGIAYADPWGHRGATHSLVFAAVVGAIAAALARAFHAPPLRTALFTTIVLASHGLLDTLTDGGLGCALLWPFDLHRYFAPWTPIPVAPIGRHFFSPRGLQVALTELLLFLPFFAFALWPARPPTHHE